MSAYSIWVLEYAYVPNYHLSGLIYETGKGAVRIFRTL